MHENSFTRKENEAFWIRAGCCLDGAVQPSVVHENVLGASALLVSYIGLGPADVIYKPMVRHAVWGTQHGGQPRFSRLQNGAVR